MNRRKALLGIASGSAAAAAGGSVYGRGRSGREDEDDEDKDKNKGEDHSSRGLTVPLSNSSGIVVGTLSIRRFEGSSDQVRAIGLVTATGATKTVVVSLSLPVTITTSAPPSNQQGACPVVRLAFAAMDLNPYGIAVLTQPLTIEVVSATGSTGDLGRRGCAIAELLDGGPPSNRTLEPLVARLNQLLHELS